MKKSIILGISGQDGSYLADVFVDFVTAEAKDVLIVPVSAVRNINNVPSVLNIDKEWMPVTTGFTDGKDVEIIKGLNVGDKIVY